MLHAALTSQPPFNPPTGAYPLAFYLDAHRHHPPPQPSQLAPAVPTGFDAAIARGMATHPADRFPTAGIWPPPPTPRCSPHPSAARAPRSPPRTTAQPPDAG